MHSSTHFDTPKSVELAYSDALVQGVVAEKRDQFILWGSLLLSWERVVGPCVKMSSLVCQT